MILFNDVEMFFSGYPQHPGYECHIEQKQCSVANDTTLQKVIPEPVLVPLDIDLSFLYF